MMTYVPDNLKEELSRAIQQSPQWNEDMLSSLKKFMEDNFHPIYGLDSEQARCSAR